MRKLLFILIGLGMADIGFAQIPANDDKEYEYKELVDVKRAGTGDVFRRIEKWANEKYGPDAEILLDDTNNRFITIHAEMHLPESHFGVNRTHRDRVVEYMLKFDIDKKEYTYRISEIRYLFEEEDRKGRITSDSLLLHQFRSPTKSSVEAEVDRAFRQLIEEIKRAGATELE